LHVAFQLRAYVERHQRAYYAQAYLALVEHAAGEHAAVAFHHRPVAEVGAVAAGVAVHLVSFLAVDLVEQLAPALSEQGDVVAFQRVVP
jgi:hypothetical protein